MKKETIESDLDNCTKQLLLLARKLTFNRISENCFYILSEINDNEANFFIRNEIRKKENNKKKPKPLSEVVPELESLFSELYDVNLYVYKAKFTIIEIQYYSRSSLDPGYRKSVEMKETMLHAKGAIPPYCQDGKEKFDLHWQLGSIHHKWKMFWLAYKLRKEHRSRPSP